MKTTMSTSEIAAELDAAVGILETVYGKDTDVTRTIAGDHPALITDTVCAAACYRDALARRGWTVRVLPPTQTSEPMVLIEKGVW